MRDFLHVIMRENTSSFIFNTLCKVPVVLIACIYAMIFCIHGRTTIISTYCARSIEFRRSSS